MFKDDLLKGKTILITGGGTGLGLAMSHQVASYATRVFPGSTEATQGC